MRRFRRGFTMIEMLTVLLVISALVMLLLPAVQSAREMARRSSCGSNLMQVGLAVHAYHVAFEQLPTPLSGTDGSDEPGADNDRRLSIFVALLPFMDAATLADEIDSPLNKRVVAVEMDMFAYDDFGETAMEAGDEEPDQPWPAGGPEPFESTYPPWRSELPWLRCPSDPGIGSPGIGRVNYAICLGDGVVGSDTGPAKSVKGRFVGDPELAAQCDASMRGMFVPRRTMRRRDTRDGLAHTILLAEIATDLGDRDRRTKPVAGPGGKVLRDSPDWGRHCEWFDRERPQFWQSDQSKLETNLGWARGLRWADGMPLYTAMYTILPPNRESVMRADCDDCWGILPPSSRHQGGVQVCFGDGSVRFVTDSIDAGDESQPTVYLGSDNPPESPSPYGLWGAMGTRASGELRWDAPYR